jgi:hypothetical protein
MEVYGFQAVTFVIMLRRMLFLLYFASALPIFLHLRSIDDGFPVNLPDALIQGF